MRWRSARRPRSAPARRRDGCGPASPRRPATVRSRRHRRATPGSRPRPRVRARVRWPRKGRSSTGSPSEPGRRRRPPRPTASRPATGTQSTPRAEAPDGRAEARRRRPAPRRSAGASTSATGAGSATSPRNRRVTCHWSAVVQRTPSSSGRGSAARVATTAGGGHTATNSRIGLTAGGIAREDRPSLPPVRAIERVLSPIEPEAVAQQVEHRDGGELADPVAVAGQLDRAATRPRRRGRGRRTRCPAGWPSCSAGPATPVTASPTSAPSTRAGARRPSPRPPPPTRPGPRARRAGRTSPRWRRRRPSPGTTSLAPGRGGEPGRRSARR